MDRVPATQIPRSWLFRRHSINRLTSWQPFLELNPVCCLKYHQLLCIFILKGNPSCFSEPVEPVESSTSSPCHHFSQEAPAASRQAMMSANYECLGSYGKLHPLEAKQVWWDAPLLFGHSGEFRLTIENHLFNKVNQLTAYFHGHFQ